MEKRLLELLEKLIESYNENSYLGLEQLAKGNKESSNFHYGMKSQAQHGIEELAKILGVKVRYVMQVMEHGNEYFTKQYFQAKIIED